MLPAQHFGSHKKVTFSHKQSCSESPVKFSLGSNYSNAWSDWRGRAEVSSLGHSPVAVPWGLVVWDCLQRTVMTGVLGKQPNLLASRATLFSSLIHCPWSNSMIQIWKVHNCKHQHAIFTLYASFHVSWHFGSKLWCRVLRVPCVNIMLIQERWDYYRQVCLRHSLVVLLKKRI